MAEKRYYWIKLHSNFMNSDAVDFLMSQKNGAEYVVLYQKLCFMTIQTNGELARMIGEILMPYDAEKIQRDCKHFSIDTVRVALELYKQLGLIYMQENGVLKIADYDKMVGSECKSAERVRQFRENKRALQCNKNVTIEIDIDKDIDKEIDKEIDIYNNKEKKEKKEKSTNEALEAAASVGQSPTTLVSQIVYYLNFMTGKSFSEKTDNTKKHINARLREKYTLDDFKAVIDFKTAEWNGNEMQQFLRPYTLFGVKFESYLQAAKVWQKEQAIKEEKAAKQIEAERKVAEEHREAERMQRFLQDDTYRKLEARRKQLVLALSKGECTQSEYNTAVEAVERRKGEL